MSTRTLRPKKRSEKTSLTWNSGGWVRWLPFWLLIWVGFILAGELALVMRWFAWVLYFFFWVPFSFRVSRRIAILFGRIPEIRVTGTPQAKFLSSENCPHCGKPVQKDHAICPHCYEDLKSNCRGCGRPISVSSDLCDKCMEKQPFAFRKSL